MLKTLTLQENGAGQELADDNPESAAFRAVEKGGVDKVRIFEGMTT